MMLLSMHSRVRCFLLSFQHANLIWDLLSDDEPESAAAVARGMGGWSVGAQHTRTRMSRSGALLSGKCRVGRQILNAQFLTLHVDSYYSCSLVTPERKTIRFSSSSAQWGPRKPSPVAVQTSPTARPSARPSFVAFARSIESARRIPPIYLPIPYNQLVRPVASTQYYCTLSTMNRV